MLVGGVAVTMRLSPWCAWLAQPCSVRLPAPLWPPWSAARRRLGAGRAPVQGPVNVARVCIITRYISRAYEACRPVGPPGPQPGSVGAYAQTLHVSSCVDCTYGLRSRSSPPHCRVHHVQRGEHLG